MSERVIDAAVSAAAGAAVPAQPSGFHLLRYFSVAAACAFALVMVALAGFEWHDREAFVRAQMQQAAQQGLAQEAFARRQDEAARRDLLALHEVGHVNVARLFANALWASDIAPQLERAATHPDQACRVMPSGGTQGEARQACFAELGQRLRTDPVFAPLHAKVQALMKRSTVFELRIFDLRGITVYASDTARVGEDRSRHAGWRSAAREGKVHSELSARESPGASETQGLERDLVSSFLPVLAADDSRVVGVFELVSDVTPTLQRLAATAAQVRQAALADQAAARAGAVVFHEQVRQAARTKLLTVLGLLLLLFVALYFFVRHADRVLARQAEERALAQRQLVQAERSASLGQMVAGVAHQLNTPLAYSRNNLRLASARLSELELPLRVAGSLARLVDRTEHDRVTLDVRRARAQLRRVQAGRLDVAEPLDMLADTLHGIEQMRELVQNLRDFTRLDRSKAARVDLNRVLHNVVYIARCVVSAEVNIVEDYAGELPPTHCNVSQLNQVFLNLINNAAQAIQGEGVVTVCTRRREETLVIEIRDTGCGIEPQVLPLIFEDYFTTKTQGEGTGLGLPIARTIVREHGGEIAVQSTPGVGSCFTVTLPVLTPAREASQDMAQEPVDGAGPEAAPRATQQADPEGAQESARAARPPAHHGAAA